MRILLTGGTGYIGSHTAVSLSESGHDVVLVDNLSNSQIEVLTRIEAILHKKIRFYVADIRNTVLLIEILQKEKIDAVIHLAGLKAVGESWEKPIDYYSCNVGGSISLAIAMKATGIRTLVFSSSATVYGDPKYLPYDENHPTLPTNPYGRTKLQVEQLLQDVSNSSKEWSIACLRYFNPVGAHESALIGELPIGVPNNLVPFITQTAIGKREVLTVFGDDYPTPDGTCIRDYIHVVDLALAHVAAINYLAQKKYTEAFSVFNIGTGKGNSVLEVIKTFEAVSKVKLNYKIGARRAGDVIQVYAACDKAANELGWRTQKSLEECMLSAWKWEKAIASTGK
jgi:UDP-glucose 4-epimerase